MLLYAMLCPRAVNREFNSFPCPVPLFPRSRFYFPTPSQFPTWTVIFSFIIVLIISETVLIRKVNRVPLIDLLLYRTNSSCELCFILSLGTKSHHGSVLFLTLLVVYIDNCVTMKGILLSKFRIHAKGAKAFALSG